MVEAILKVSWIDMMALAFVVILALLVGWSAVAAKRRARQLSKEDPPSAAELLEVRALRLAGPFHLRGRSSAQARHFEETWQQIDRSSRGGPGCYEPPLVKTWRDQRTTV